MKRFATLLLAVSMCAGLLLTSCTPQNQSSSSSNAASVPGSESTPAASAGDVSNLDTLKVQTGDGSDMADAQDLRISISTTPSGAFNPALTTDNTLAYVTALVYDSILRYTPDYQFEPGIAKSWEISEDSKTITLHFPENATWHDGEKFSAKDVLFTLKFMGDPKYPGQFYTKVSAIKGMEDYKSGKATDVEGIKLIDENTLEITTAEVYAPLLSNLAEIYVIPEHIWGKIDISTAMEQTELLQKPVGTGPFKLKEFVLDQYCSFDRNDQYWEGVPKLKTILLQSVNAETAQGQILNGETDMLSVSDMSQQSLDIYNQAGIPIDVCYWTSYREIGLNARTPLLQKKEVRQALCTGFDRAGICKSVYNGYATVAKTCYAPFFWSYPGDAELNAYDYDPEKAKAMLLEAGWEYKDGTMYADGKPVEFTLCTVSSAQGDAVLAVFQENMKSLGIKVTVQNMEFATQLAQLREGTGWDMYYLGMGTGSDPDGRLAYASYSIGQGNNFTGYANEELDKLLEEGVKYVDVEQRKPIYFQVAKLMNEELPSIFVCNWADGMAVNPQLRNYKITPNVKYYHILDWYFAK